MISYLGSLSHSFFFGSGGGAYSVDIIVLVDMNWCFLLYTNEVVL